MLYIKLCQREFSNHHSEYRPVVFGTDTKLIDFIIISYNTAFQKEADYVLTVNGDSMQPMFNDGDKVYVVNQQSVEIGEIGIFIINSEAYIKKLGKDQLISLNEKYKPIPLNADDSIYCCGKVIGKVEE